MAGSLKYSGLTGRRHHLRSRMAESSRHGLPRPHRRDPTSAGARSLIYRLFGDSSPYQPHTRCHSRFTSNARTARTPRRLRPRFGTGSADRSVICEECSSDVSLRLDRLALDEGGCVGPSRDTGCPQRRCDRRQRARSQHRRRKSPRHERRDALSRLRSTPAASARPVIVQL